MDLNIRGSYHAIIQPVVDVIHQKLMGVAGPAQNNALPSLVKSYAVCNTMMAVRCYGGLTRLFMLGTARSVEWICRHK